jgi:voltage-gated potassium channel
MRDSTVGFATRIRMWLARRSRHSLVRLTGSLRRIIVVYLASLVLAAALFSLLEDRTFLDSLWWAVVTALTIGYGDISPATPAGRVVSILFQHFWIFGIAPLVIANILTHVLHDENQFSHAEQEWQAAALCRIADRLGVELPPEPADTDFGDVEGFRPARDLGETGTGEMGASPLH